MVIDVANEDLGSAIDEVSKRMFRLNELEGKFKRIREVVENEEDSCCALSAIKAILDEDKEVN